MSQHKWNQQKVTEGDGNAEILPDTFAALAGSLFILFLLALIAMGVPEITWSDLQKVKKEVENEKDRAQKAEQATTKAKKHAEKIASDAKKDSAKKEHEKEKAVKAAEEALKFKPTVIVIAIDGTSSMRPSIEVLRSCIESLAETCSLIFPKFELSIVLYKKYNTVFPLTEIKPTKGEIKSTGMRSMVSFSKDKTEKIQIVESSTGEHAGKRLGRSEMHPKLSTSIGIANVERGIDKALSILSKSKQKKILVLIGDIGPWEMNKQERIDDADKLSASRMIRKIKNFSGEGSKVLALFTGMKASNIKHKNESRAFFKKIAAAAGKNGAYSENANRLSSLVIAASVKQQGGPK